MSDRSHDTLVYRLAQILVKLNQGERLDPQELADEFGVNLRTIQRDLNERFAYLPLEKSDGRYHLDPAFLGKLSTRDIERFASLAGVRDCSRRCRMTSCAISSMRGSSRRCSSRDTTTKISRIARMRSGCWSRRSWRDDTSRSNTARRTG